MRGFIKELCALMLLLLSVFLTINHYDFFTINYSKYFNSQATINILSTISVFIVLNIIFMIVNNWIMYILSPIRLGLIDRISGMFIGILKGTLLSYALFFTVNLYCHVAYYKQEIEEKQEVLPDWIISSYSYQIVFSTADDIIDTYVPESLISKIKEIGNQEKKEE